MATGCEARSAGCTWPGYRHRVPVAELLFSGKSASTDFLVRGNLVSKSNCQCHRELPQAAGDSSPAGENPSEVGYGRHEMHCAANETKPHRYRMQRYTISPARGGGEDSAPGIDFLSSLASGFY